MWVEAKQEVDRLMTELLAARSERNGLAAQLSALDEKVAEHEMYEWSLHEQLSAATDEIEVDNELLWSLHDQVQSLRDTLEGEQYEHLEELGKLTNQVNILSSQLAVQNNGDRRLKKELDDVKTERDELDALVEVLYAEISDLSHRLATTKTEAIEKEDELLDQVKALTDKLTSQEGINEQIKEVNARLDAVKEDNVQLISQVRKLTASKADMQMELKHLKASLSAANDNRDMHFRQHTKSMAETAKAKEEVTEVKTELEEIRGQRDVLAEQVKVLLFKVTAFEKTKGMGKFEKLPAVKKVEAKLEEVTNERDGLAEQVQDLTAKVTTLETMKGKLEKLSAEMATASLAITQAISDTQQHEECNDEENAADTPEDASGDDHEAYKAKLERYVWSYKKAPVGYVYYSLLDEDGDLFDTGYQAQIFVTDDNTNGVHALVDDGPLAGQYILIGNAFTINHKLSEALRLRKVDGSWVLLVEEE